MAVREILTLGHDNLRKASEKITFPLSANDKANLIDLRDTLHDFQKRNGFGRGIAGPQIGWSKQAICIDTDGSPVFLLNPKILKYSEETYHLFDDCFSMPDIMVYIERSKHIEVAYDTPQGEKVTQRFEGDLAELLQHEIDHLHGLMAIDRVRSLRDIWSKEQWLKTKG